MNSDRNIDNVCDDENSKRREEYETRYNVDRVVRSVTVVGSDYVNESGISVTFLGVRLIGRSIGRNGWQMIGWTELYIDAIDLMAN